MKDPIKYTLSDIDDLKLKLTDVIYAEGETYPIKDPITTSYTLEEEKSRKCSYCRKNKPVFIVEGLQEFKSKAKDGKYHMKFYIICKECFLAKRV